MTELPITNSENRVLSYARTGLLVVEGLILLGITIAFWYNIVQGQSSRDVWFWTLWLAIPVFFLRWKLWGRLWTHTRIHDVIIIFILLTVYNYTHALFHRESFLAATARPLSGIWIFIYFIELSRTKKRLNEVIIFVMMMALCLGIIALTSSEWTSKSSVFLLFIEALPQFDHLAAADALEGQFCSPIVNLIHSSNCFNPGFIFRTSHLTFNVNEIGGAMARLVPVMAGIALMAQTRKEEKKDPYQRGGWLILRVIAALAFVVLFCAIMFGQSRFAILGMIISLTILTFVAIPHNRWRYVALSFIGLVILLQAGIMLNIFTPDRIDDSQVVGLSGRDENSVVTRLALWDRSINMMLDYPSTGVGMYMFRTAINQEEYIIPYFVEANRTPPHAHNDWLNVGAEMGITGLLVYIAMQVVVIRALWYGWQHGDRLIRTIALALFCGFLSGAIFGIGDTIALWDRFQFINWWLIGLAGAQYVLARLQNERQLPELSLDEVT